MALLTDPELRLRFQEGLAQWNVGRGLTWKEAPTDFLRKTFPKISPARIGELLFEWVKDGREVKQVPETREPWCRVYQYHYDFVLPFKGYPKGIYIETAMLDEGRLSPPQISIVSMRPSD